MPQTPCVFISYARKDGEAFAADLVQRIEEAEIPAWRDRDGLRGGEGWWSQIDTEIPLEFSRRAVPFQSPWRKSLRMTIPR